MLPNKLSKEKSPYLLQHAENPVEWYPWGNEALEKAKKENKPILLSVGYSACHWCHVMAHESFENEQVAKVMNREFINIKVDREERPDIDQIYQNVAQIITRNGGWPLTVFLTPDCKPFYGGTYFPLRSMHGRPGFLDLLENLAHMYRNNLEGILDNSQKILHAISQMEDLPQLDTGSTAIKKNEIPEEYLNKSAETLMNYLDMVDGGFGSAPKFPQSMGLSFLWRWGTIRESSKALNGVLFSLKKMASGGIYDHLGGGFSRYSTDDQWLIPHFEKMLYDNALLLKLYSEVLLSKKFLPPSVSFSKELESFFLQVISETSNWVLSEMQSPHGLFYSALDADSEGEEGKFYVWTKNEIFEHLNPQEASDFCDFYAVTVEGNFENTNACALSRKYEEGKTPDNILKSKQILFEKRKERIRPGLDDKILTSWNSLMISGLLWSAKALEASDADQSKKLTVAAKKAFSTLLERATFKKGNHFMLNAVLDEEGASRLNGYLDDYAFLCKAALDIFRFVENKAFREVALSVALDLAQTLHAEFKDTKNLGYFFTANSHETLIQRPKTVFDQALPSGTAVALECLLILKEIEPEKNQYDFVIPELHALMEIFKDHSLGVSEIFNVGLEAFYGPVIFKGNPSAEEPVIHPHLYYMPSEESSPLLCHRQACQDLKQTPENQIQEKILEALFIL